MWGAGRSVGAGRRRPVHDIPCDHPRGRRRRRLEALAPRWAQAALCYHTSRANEPSDGEVRVRITFIEPAAPGFHVYSFVRQLRLGLPLLGALMKARGHEVRIYAESLSEVDWDDVLSSDLVGISTTTSTAIRAYQYAQRVRDAGIPTVMGGPHVTFLADEAMDFCDYVVRNEGE